MATVERDSSSIEKDVIKDAEKQAHLGELAKPYSNK